MSYQAKVYRVFIASPSDLVEERDFIPELIHTWNDNNSYRTKIVLEPVLWETHAVPEQGNDPQSIINNKLVKKCDILIGTFWTRIGTATSRFESGTIEEIEETIKDHKPVLLYFSKRPFSPKKEDLEQYERLLDLKERYRRNGIVFDYDSKEKLKDLLNRHLTHIVDEFHKDTQVVAIANHLDNKTMSQTPENNRDDTKNSTIGGKISDQSGYSVCEAIVSLHHVKLEYSRWIVTDKVAIPNNSQRSGNYGDYHFVNVKEGRYAIIVKCNGDITTKVVRHDNGNTIEDITFGNGDLVSLPRV